MEVEEGEVKGGRLSHAVGWLNNLIVNQARDKVKESVSMRWAQTERKRKWIKEEAFNVLL